MIQVMLISNINKKHTDKLINMGPCHTCNGSNLIKDCNKSTCCICKPNLDKHRPSKCPRKCPFNKQLNPNPFHNTNNSNRNKISNHNKPNLQISISTNKPDHMAELLEATRKIAKYFKRSYEHSKPHPNDNSNHQTSINQYRNSHSDRHKNKAHNNSSN